jgi:hypothetical protein
LDDKSLSDTGRHGNRTLARAAGALLIAALCVAPRPAPAATVAPFVTLSGANSHVTEARCLRITTADDWAAIWLEHVGEPPKPQYNLYFNKAGLPVVDFERCMVIAVFAGASGNCAGVSAVAGPLEDPEAETKTPVAAGDMVLRLAWHEYQTAGPDGGGVDANPFGFFVVPRTQAPLVVQDRVMPLGGGHGRLEQRALLPALPEGGR